MQPVNTGRSIAGGHDGGEYPLTARDLAWCRTRYPYIFLLLRDARLTVLLGVEGGRAVSDLLPSTGTMLGSTERLLLYGPAKSNPERIFLVGELVDQISSV